MTRSAEVRKTKWLPAIPIFCLLAMSAPDASGQTLFLGAVGGVSQISQGSDDPVANWDKGWTAGFDVEFRVLSFLGVTFQYGYHRITYRGGTEFSGGTVQSEWGDPLRITELSLGARVYLGPLYLLLRTGSYKFEFGRQIQTYIPAGSSTPTTWVRNPESFRSGGNGVGVGLQVEPLETIWVAGEVRMAFISKTPSLGVISLSLKKEMH